MLDVGSLFLMINLESSSHPDAHPNANRTPSAKVNAKYANLKVKLDATANPDGIQEMT